MQVSRPMHGKEHPVAEDRIALLDQLRKGEEAGGDFLRAALQQRLQALLEAAVSAPLGAERYARSDDRTPQRNGSRPRSYDTRLGTSERAIPQLRTGSDFPTWLEPRRRAEPALGSVVAAAYVQGVSTRKVAALVQHLGITSLSKSEVSRMAPSLDEQGRRFRERRLDAVSPSVWLAARYEHVREDGRVHSMAVVVA